MELGPLSFSSVRILLLRLYTAIRIVDIAVVAKQVIPLLDEARASVVSFCTIVSFRKWLKTRVRIIVSRIAAWSSSGSFRRPLGIWK